MAESSTSGVQLLNIFGVVPGSGESIKYDTKDATAETTAAGKQIALLQNIASKGVATASSIASNIGLVADVGYKKVATDFDPTPPDRIEQTNLAAWELNKIDSWELARKADWALAKSTLFDLAPDTRYELQKSTLFPLTKSTAFTLQKTSDWALQKSTTFDLQKNTNYKLAANSEFDLTKDSAWALAKNTDFDLTKVSDYSLSSSGKFDLSKDSAWALTKSTNFALAKIAGYGLTVQTDFDVKKQSDWDLRKSSDFKLSKNSDFALAKTADFDLRQDNTWAVANVNQWVSPSAANVTLPALPTIPTGMSYDYGDLNTKLVARIEALKNSWLAKLIPDVDGDFSALNTMLNNIVSGTIISPTDQADLDNIMRELRDIVTSVIASTRSRLDGYYASAVSDRDAGSMRMSTAEASYLAFVGLLDTDSTWNIAAAKATKNSAYNERRMMAEWSSRGFSLPTGVANSNLLNLRQEASESLALVAATMVVEKVKAKVEAQKYVLDVEYRRIESDNARMLAYHQLELSTATRIAELELENRRSEASTAISVSGLKLDTTKFAANLSSQYRLGVMAAMNGLIQAYSSTASTEVQYNEAIANAQRQAHASILAYYQAALQNAEFGLKTESTSKDLQLRAATQTSQLQLSAASTKQEADLKASIADADYTLRAAQASAENNIRAAQASAEQRLKAATASQSAQLQADVANAEFVLKSAQAELSAALEAASKVSDQRLKSAVAEQAAQLQADVASAEMRLKASTAALDAQLNAASRVAEQRLKAATADQSNQLQADLATAEFRLKAAQTELNASLEAASKVLAASLEASTTEQKSALQASLATAEMKLKAASTAQSAAIQAALADQDTALKAAVANGEFSLKASLANADFGLKAETTAEDIQLKYAQLGANYIGTTVGNYVAAAAKSMDGFSTIAGMALSGLNGIATIAAQE